MPKCVESHLPQSPNTNIRLFKERSSPNWEDYRNGGQLSMRLKRETSARLWQKLTESVLNGTIPHIDHIAGLVLSTRLNSNAAHIWCREATELAKNQAIMHYAQKELGVHAVFVPFQVMKSRNMRIRTNPEAFEKKVETDAEVARRLSSASTAPNSRKCSNIMVEEPPTPSIMDASSVGPTRNGEECGVAEKAAAILLREAAVVNSPPFSSPPCLPPEVFKAKAEDPPLAAAPSADPTAFTIMSSRLIPVLVLILAIVSAVAATASAAASVL